MANYAHVKDRIAANVYTNHDGLVTAENVKTAINEVVDTLIAGGYLYAGVAKLTPTQTNPGSPDANVFYIATEPGTYTNFVGAGGSLVVAEGEVAIFKFNGTWSKEVTGAATAAQVTELGQEATNVEKLLGYDFVDCPLALVVGSLYNGVLDTNSKGNLSSSNFSEVLGGTSVKLYHANDIPIRLTQYDSSKAYITNTGAYSKTISEVVVEHNCAYVKISAGYGERGYSSDNPVSPSDFQDGDFGFKVVGSSVLDSIQDNPQLKLYECSTAADIVAKVVSAPGYKPTVGGSIKIKFTNGVMVSTNATLNINGQGAKPFYYNGSRVNIYNVIPTNEVVEVYYDGTNYHAFGESMYKLFPNNQLRGYWDASASVEAHLIYGNYVSIKLLVDGMWLKEGDKIVYYGRSYQKSVVACGADNKLLQSTSWSTAGFYEYTIQSGDTYLYFNFNRAANYFLLLPHTISNSPYIRTDFQFVDYNVSELFPTGGISSTNRYDLATAIGVVPINIRTQGFVLKFIDNFSLKNVLWKYIGNTLADFTDTTKWTPLDISSIQDNLVVIKTTDQTKAFAALFQSAVGEVEPFVFFTDPHWFVNYNSIARYPSDAAVQHSLRTIKEVFDNTPTNFVLCGGDWLNSHKQSVAVKALGWIDGFTNKLFPDAYYPMFGNHDDNYLGELDTTTDPDANDGELSTQQMVNLMFRKFGRMYYAFKGTSSRFYVFDSGLDTNSFGMTDYRWMQVNWFDEQLRANNDEHIVLAIHIVTVTGLLAVLADNVTKLANAFNNRTSVTLENGRTYDYSNLPVRYSGKVSCIIYGHTHQDAIGSFNNIPAISTTTAQQGDFDIMLLDYASAKLKTIRVGTGDNREMSIIV